MVALIALLFWAAMSHLEVFPSTAFPSPRDVWRGLVEKAVHGTIFDDIVASLFRVTMGFGLAVTLGVPIGLWLGLRVRIRLAWIPFAILWFGIGDLPSIFLIFMTAFFPMVLATSAAVSGILTVYFRVARNCEIEGRELLTQVTLPAIAPQVITALRVTAGRPEIPHLGRSQPAPPRPRGRGDGDHNQPAGTAAFYLVTGMAGSIESSLGTNSSGVPRTNTNPCP